MRIKVDPLDRLFSQYIKARDKYCQRCGGSGGLQTSHFHGRRKRSTRYDPDNACLLCFGCHHYFHANPLIYVQWFQNHIGEDAFDLLEARARKPQKIDVEAIGLFLKEELRKLEE